MDTRIDMMRKMAPAAARIPSCGFFFKKPISKILLFFYLYKNIPRSLFYDKKQIKTVKFYDANL